MRPTRNAVPTLLLLAALVAGGCGSSGERVSRNQNVLTREEIVEAGVANLEEAVERLRPRWLQVRSVTSLGSGPAQIVVFLNNAYLGGPSTLREFQARDIAELRYLDGPRAAATLQGYPSTTHLAGAIVLVTSQ